MNTPILELATRSNRKVYLALGFGFLMGYFLAEMLISVRYPVIPDDYERFKYMERMNKPRNSHDLIEAAGPEQDVGSHEHIHENASIADQLYKEVRVLCWIMTNPTNHKAKALHVKRTWGKRCNKLLFMSSGADEELGTVVLPVHEGRNNLWRKVKLAFKYVYKHHFNDADWFIKADDDSYVIMENLRYMLYPYSPETPLYFGCKFKPFIEMGYMSGGSGYVLSKEALRRFIEEAIPDPSLCLPGTVENEDIEVGNCLQNVEVISPDTRDSDGRGRFLPLVPEDVLIPGQAPQWYGDYLFYPQKEGLECCSDNAISFHYISPNQMYVMEYLIYHLYPYGRLMSNRPLPAKLGVGETMPPPVDASKNSTNTDSQT